MLSSGNNCPSLSNQSYVTRIGVINNLGWLLTLAPAPAPDKPLGDEIPPASAPPVSSTKLVIEVTSEKENAHVTVPLAYQLPQLPSLPEPQEDVEVDVSSWGRVYEDLLREYGQERSYLHQD